MGRRLILLLGFLLLTAGVIVRAYPYVNNWLTEYEADLRISDYRKAVQEKDDASIKEMQEKAGRYNELLSQGESFSVADYNEMLAVTDAIGYLEIPRLDVYLPIYHGVDEEVLERGIGHMPNTSLPVGGPSTHCVLSGHTGLPTAKIFTNLDEMEKGDLFYIHVLDQTLAYEVDQSCVVLPDETDAIKIVEGKDYVTLLTCIPYGVNSHRLLVRGERTEYVPQEITVQMPQVQDSSNKLPTEVVEKGMIAAICALVLVISLLILFVPERGTKNKRKD